MSLLDPSLLRISELEVQHKNCIVQINNLTRLLNDTQQQLKEARETVMMTQSYFQTMTMVSEEFMKLLAEKYPDEFVTDETKTQFKIQPVTFIQLLLRTILEKDLIFDIFEKDKLTGSNK